MCKLRLKQVLCTTEDHDDMIQLRRGRHDSSVVIKVVEGRLVARAEIEVDRLLYHLSEVFPHKELEEDVHINLLLGDEVYWNDPDEGTCSGHGTFVRHLDDGAAIIRKDDVEIEVFVKELS